MARKAKTEKEKNQAAGKSLNVAQGRLSALVDTRVIYCGDNLEQLKELPEGCVNLADLYRPAL